MKDELMDIYDENKNLIGRTINRKNRNILKKDEYVITAHWFIINSSKQVLLTQRSLNMNRTEKLEDTHGGIKSGETSIEGIIRELKEEIGINIEKCELKLVKTIKKKNAFRDIYILKKDIPLESLEFNDNEVMSCKYVTIDEFKEMIKERKVHIYKFWANYFLW